MPLLEVVGMTPTGKNFTVASAFMRNEQATTYRWALQQIKYLYFSNTMSTENQEDVCETMPKTTNRAESEHSVLKLWLSTCHGDLDTVFLNIDSLIEGQIADIKASLEFSRTKEKHNAKSNHIFYILHDIDVFWQTLEIGSPHPSARQQDLDSEMRSLTDLLHQISTGPISKVREMRRLAKGVLNPVLPKDPGVTLTSPPKIQKSSGSVSGSGTGSGSLPGLGSGSGSRGRGRPPRAPRERGRGRYHGRNNLSAAKHASPCSTFPYTNAFPAFIYPFISNWKNVIGDGNCGSRIVADFVFGDGHQWPEVRRGTLYELEHSTNLYVNLVGSEERVNELVHGINWLVDGPASYAHWFETPNSLYIVANAFNLYVILIAQLGSTTMLPLYSYSDRPEGTLVIGFLTEERHFIQFF
ncbi:hypothetical protein M9H77_02801 [Catharanthus roseus]|uniref:Uncharacterized protein n=1 Tax=Catharanthus roseus TaxID=4058 RepID=A0ACC0C9V8_CATRO|nr:hypothetical protein M9H77_02801 [Catharanthus roseus]